MNESQRPVCQRTKGPKSETVLDKWCGDDGQKTPNTQDPGKGGGGGAGSAPGTMAAGSELQPKGYTFFVRGVFLNSTSETEIKMRPLWETRWHNDEDTMQDPA